MPDDQKRLEAEGAVQGLSASLLDLVARREVLAARVRHKIKLGDFPAAQVLIKDLRDLDYNIDLFNRLDCVLDDIGQRLTQLPPVAN